MAGRPAPISSGRSPLLYWVITFVILWVITLVLFILQFTTNQSLVSQAASARQAVTAVGTPPQYYRDEAAARKTSASAVMNDDIRRMATLVSGSPDDVASAIQQKAERLMTEVAGNAAGGINPTDTLLTAIEKLDRLRSEARAEADANQRAKRDLEDRNAALTQQLRSTTETFEQQVGELNTRLTSVREEGLASLRQKDAQLRDMEDQIKALTQQVVSLEREGTTIARDRDIEVGRLQGIVDDLQGQIRALRPTTFNPEAILTKADARIIRSVPGSDVVYLNVGTNDRIRVGMGFEVFDPQRRPGANLRGKASLEVVHIMEDTAECRVTRRSGDQPIVEGDVAVNIAFERGRKPKFVVRGDFDLNYDGLPDANGFDEVASMIRGWGGEIVGDLDETVDFLLVGMAPVVPGAAQPAQPSPIVRDQIRNRGEQAEAFRDEITRAQRMYIPVITQTQFLYLTGFSGDPVVSRQ